MGVSYGNKNIRYFQERPVILSKMRFSRVDENI